MAANKTPIAYMAVSTMAASKTPIADLAVSMMDFVRFKNQLQENEVRLSWTRRETEVLPSVPFCRTTAFHYENSDYQVARMYFDSTTGPILIIDCNSKAQDRGILKTKEGYFVYVVFKAKIKYYKSNQ
jgi:hypothetical protein